MAAIHSTLPFPDNIDRDDFGHWLSGFVDGEGSFVLTDKRSTVRKDPSCNLRAIFQINMRADEEEIITTIKSYFQCGTISFKPAKGNANPMIEFRVDATGDLKNIVVAHFDRYPLRAKKRRDFAIWRKAVALLYEIKKRKVQSKGGRSGTCSKWKQPEIAAFLSLHDAIREQRIYNQRHIPVPSGDAYIEPSLFDQFH